MSWLKFNSKVDNKVNKNNTINIIQNNTEALLQLKTSIDKLNETLEDHEKRISKLERRGK